MQLRPALAFGVMRIATTIAVLLALSSCRVAARHPSAEAETPATPQASTVQVETMEPPMAILDRIEAAIADGDLALAEHHCRQLRWATDEVAQDEALLWRLREYEREIGGGRELQSQGAAALGRLRSSWDAEQPSPSYALPSTMWARLPGEASVTQTHEVLLAGALLDEIGGQGRADALFDTLSSSH